MRDDQTGPEQTATDNPSPKERTLLVMQLPIFREGYGNARRCFFERREPDSYTLDDDQTIVDDLKDIFEEWQRSRNEDDLHYSIGSLFGHMSAHHIPQHEGMGVLRVTIDEHGVRAYGRCSECGKPLRYP